MNTLKRNLLEDGDDKYSLLSQDAFHSVKFYSIHLAQNGAINNLTRLIHPGLINQLTHFLIHCLNAIIQRLSFVVNNRKQIFSDICKMVT